MNAKKNNNFISKFLSKISSSPRRSSSEKANFVTEETIFYKALNRDARQYPKLTKKH